MKDRLVLLTLLAGLCLSGCRSQAGRATSVSVAATVPAATATPERLFPTQTPVLLPPSPTQPQPTPLRPSRTAEATVVATQSPTAQPADWLPFADRFGVAGSQQLVRPALQAGLPFRHTYNWHIESMPVESDEVTFWQMIRVSEEGVVLTWDRIAEVIASQPGAIWMIGNEPDVIWQDNVTPARYAELYHLAYEFIKARDPQAQIAIGSVAQGTPLRLAYLDAVLQNYELTHGVPMPVDIWTVHAYTLREEAGSWGVEIPPGMDVLQGRLYEIVDHGDLAIFQQNLIDFRAWMAERGYRERPLAVTEFGIIMPNDYGFPPESIAAYMEAAFDFLLSATNETGYPADGNRLVQLWFWFSLYETPDFYPTGNLFDPESQSLTLLGQTYADYVNNRGRATTGD